MTVVTWPDEVDDILGGDLTCALAYLTPAGGTVVSAVAPIGLRDRAKGTVGFTTSLGFGRKLERIKRDPRVALAYHARKHGLGDLGNQRYVLVQGTATFEVSPDSAMLEEIGERVVPFMGPPRRGRFWDSWLSAYYRDRILVTVAVHRIVVWPDLDTEGVPEVFGEPLPVGAVSSQQPPAQGAAPRVDVPKAAANAERLAHCLLGFAQADGFPAIVPVRPTGSGPEGLHLDIPAGAPAGGRRAGLLSHDYRPKLIGLESRQHTGWLESAGTTGTYAPHTSSGFAAPANKTVLLLANGFLARRGLKRAKQEGLLEALR
ncbi:hypothetical protein OHB26_29540 [Nocardia sp. NBC_01503]|uniref:pyridoxamine 5'-phosphate oxidase family protein n=1 Tax=Nocardia sp. NBC_01503 TaxID=2975997 RepID=UPI002E7AD250|nr:hypothetical protein [Nocardia sp. NBC_01503]WTL31030.1 hypothetical protein OHB26_29540 [Nocardia sp. NBC_01503]